eukprot:9257387-Pyramimonas_sp.AAC.1
MRGMANGGGGGRRRIEKEKEEDLTMVGTRTPPVLPLIHAEIRDLQHRAIAAETGEHGCGWRAHVGLKNI